MPSVVVVETPHVVPVRRGGGGEDGPLPALRGGVQGSPVAVLVVRRREDDARSLPGRPVQEQSVANVGPLRQDSRRSRRTIDRLGFTVKCISLSYRGLLFLFSSSFAPNCWKLIFADQDASSRRENNPFSFKAFLKNGTQQTSYHNTGARPKVYSSSASSPGLDKDNVGVYAARNPTELPDFVQDHLVIEQCYLNHENSQPILPDVDNLPDFALNSVEQRQSRLRSEKKNDSNVLCDDLRSFDLTGRLHKGLPHRDHSNAMHSNHLDLPAFEDRLNETEPILPRPEHRGTLHFIFRTMYNCSW